jgi:hypothetical protein
MMLLNKTSLVKKRRVITRRIVKMNNSHKGSVSLSRLVVGVLYLTCVKDVSHFAISCSLTLSRSFLEQPGVTSLMRKRGVI